MQLNVGDSVGGIYKKSKRRISIWAMDIRRNQSVGINYGKE